MAVDWDVSMDEAGLARVLAQMEEQRALGNDAEVANGYLSLSQLDKWVKIDDQHGFFTRTEAFADKALAIFRRLGDRTGEARALRMAGGPFDTEARTKNVDEALVICLELGDELEIARCLARQSQLLGLTDLEIASSKNREALAIFERFDDARGQAWCWFSLAIQGDDDTEKFDASLKAAHFFRRIGDFAHAARSAMLADMYGRDRLTNFIRFCCKGWRMRNPRGRLRSSTACSSRCPELRRTWVTFKQPTSIVRVRTRWTDGHHSKSWKTGWKWRKIC